jgi:predicted nuclease of predicted toxin-antitoxin system
MKLLFDHNLFPGLVRSLSSLYPNSVHVRDVNLHTEDDESAWNYAALHGFVLVSKDADFHQRSFAHGAPPKVIWIRLGNCRTNQIEALLHAYVQEVEAFTRDEEATFLALG